MKLDKMKKKLLLHPLKKELFETRIKYIQAIAFFIAIDDNISDEEQKSYLELVEILECKDLQDDLLEFLHNTDEEEPEKVFDIFENHTQLLYFYLSEIAYRASQDGLNKDEKEFLEFIEERYSLQSERVEALFDYIHALTKDDMQLKIKSAFKLISHKDLVSKIEPFLECYKLDKPDKFITIDELQHGKKSLKDMDAHLRDDKDIVLEAVKQNGWVLYYASQRLKDDKDIILEAVKQDYLALEYASERLQNDSDILALLHDED